MSPQASSTETNGRRLSVRSLTFRVAFGTLLATGLVALLVGMLIRSINNLRAADRADGRSQEVLLRLARTQSDVVDLESGVRGYVITALPSFLQPFQSASAHVDGSTDGLAGALAGRERRQAQMLRVQIDAYISEYARPLIALVGQHPAAALSVPRTSEGKRRIDVIRATIRAIEATEAGRQGGRRRHAQSTASAAVSEALVVFGLLLALIVLLAFALQRLVLTPARRLERSHRLATMLSDASATLDSSLDTAITLPRLGRLLDSEFADWTILALRRDDGSLDFLAGESGLMPPTAAAQAEAVLLADRRQIAAPILSRGRELGTLVLARTARVFDEDDLDCAREIARRVALAVETAGLYEQSTATARVLQDSLLPERLPLVAGLEIASRFRPAGHGTRVGGDFYDVFPTSPGSWAILVGDVCGKGAAAAAVTAMVRYTLRAFAPRALSPSQALSELNQAMLHQSHDGRFVTLAYATLELRGEHPRLTVACGGHPAPLLLRGASGVAEPVGVRGTLIGIFDEIEVEEASFDLDEGDALVLYSDGVTEARRGEAFTAEELALRLTGDASAEELAEAIDRLAMETRAPRQDDVAILAVRYVHRNDSLQLDLPSDVAAPGLARRELNKLDLGDNQRQVATLLTSELVTNAVLHGGASHMIRLTATTTDGTLHVTVSDAGAGFSLPLEPRAADAPGGYGLALVDQLAARWGVHRDRGSTVWFEV